VERRTFLAMIAGGMVAPPLAAGGVRIGNEQS